MCVCVCVSLPFMYQSVDACLRCQTDGKQEECVGKQLFVNRTHSNNAISKYHDCFIRVYCVKMFRINFAIILILGIIGFILAMH